MGFENCQLFFGRPLNNVQFHRTFEVDVLFEELASQGVQFMFESAFVEVESLQFENSTLNGFCLHLNDFTSLSLVVDGESPDATRTHSLRDAGVAAFHHIAGVTLLRRCEEEPSGAEQTR